MNKLLIIVLIVLVGASLTTSPVSGATLYQEDFESGLDGWHRSTTNSNLISTVAGQGRQGSTALAIKPNATQPNPYVYYFINGWGRASVWIKDDLSLLNDPTKDTFAWFSVNTNGQAGGLSIGIRPQTSIANYVYCPTSNFALCMDTGIPRTNGFHNFKIFVTPKGAYGKIDGHSLSYLPTKYLNKSVQGSEHATAILPDATSFSRINLGVSGATISNFIYFDDVYIDDWPADTSSGKEINLAKKFVNIFLGNYGNVDPNQVISGINSSTTNGYSWKNCNNDVQCFERKLQAYIALVNTASAHAAQYKVTGNATNLNKATQILQAVVNNRTTAPWIESSQNNQLGGSRLDTALANAVILLGDDMPQVLSDSIKNILVTDASIFTNSFRGYSCYGKPENGCVNGDTSGENNGWAGTFLHRLSIAYPDHPNVSVWKDNARVYIFHTKTLGETDPIKGITTQTLWTDPAYYLENHNYKPHPGYTLGVVYDSVLADKIERLVQGTNPYPELAHNVTETWLANRAFIDFSQFKLNTQNHPENHQGGEGDASSAWVSLTYFQVLEDLYPSTNAVGGTSDLAEHAYEYEYYIKDSFLFKPVAGSVSISSSDVVDYNDKFKTWFGNSFIAVDPVQYLMLYDLGSYQSGGPDPSPSPAAVPGDFTGDNQVNMDDYNLVVGGYGTGYDIFDLNLVVSNFGL